MFDVLLENVCTFAIFFLALVASSCDAWWWWRRRPIIIIKCLLFLGNFARKTTRRGCKARGALHKTRTRKASPKKSAKHEWKTNDDDDADDVTLICGRSRNRVTCKHVVAGVGWGLCCVCVCCVKQRNRGFVKLRPVGWLKCTRFKGPFCVDVDCRMSERLICPSVAGENSQLFFG